MFSALQFYVIGLLLACCTVACFPLDDLLVYPLENVNYDGKEITICDGVAVHVVENKPAITSKIRPGHFLLVMVQYPQFNATHSELHWLADVDVQAASFDELKTHFEYTAPQTSGIDQLYVMLFYKGDPNQNFTQADVINLYELELNYGLVLDAYFAFILEN